MDQDLKDKAEPRQQRHQLTGAGGQEGSASIIYLCFPMDRDNLNPQENSQRHFSLHLLRPWYVLERKFTSLPKYTEAGASITLT